MIFFRGRSKDIVYEVTKQVKWGFRQYVLADAQTGYIYCFKLLEELEDNEKGKMYGLIQEFIYNKDKKNIY